MLRIFLSIIGGNRFCKRLYLERTSSILAKASKRNPLLLQIANEFEDDLIDNRVYKGKDVETSLDSDNIARR
jgi:hypothetical protein